jgi:drug/metabolite transporter (DMT)-like permease
VQAVGGMLLNTLFAAVVWQERFVRMTLLGMGIALVGLVLVNVR